MSERVARLFAAMSHDLYPAFILAAILFGIASYGCTVGEKRLAEDPNCFQLRVLHVLHGLARSFCALNILVFGFSFCHFGCAALMAHRSTCISNLKQLSMATSMYSEDYGELPPCSRWSEAIESRVSKAADSAAYRAEHPFQCPAAETKASYGMNSALDRLSMEKIDLPAYTVLYFEAEAPYRSFAGGKQNVAAERHSLGANYAFVDGHSKYFYPKAAGSISWMAKSSMNGTTGQ
jgi:prepilin-type processing-associated H-X9-DG protein